MTRHILTNSPYFDSVQSYLAQSLDAANDWILEHPYFTGIQLLVFSASFFYFLHTAFPAPSVLEHTSQAVPKAVMSNLPAAANVVASQPPELDPPKDTPFTVEELKQYDGTDESKPVYVAIKGQIFDVSGKRDMYGPGAGYHIFAGKDASRGLGKSSLKPEDAVSDYSTLEDSEKTVLDDWVKYFTKRYNIVGKVKT